MVAIVAIFLLLPIFPLIYDGLATKDEGQSVSLPFTRVLAITSLRSNIIELRRRFAVAHMGDLLPTEAQTDAGSEGLAHPGI